MAEHQSWDRTTQKKSGTKGNRFGDRLKTSRVAAGLSQQELAKRAGIPLATIQSWEINRRRPLAMMAARVAKALGVRVPELMS